VTSKYVQHGQLVIQTNKAKTNPIQTQFIERAKLMQSVYLQRIMKNNADMGQKKQSQFKANLVRRRRIANELFCVDKELYYCFNNTTRGIYHPKGCQFKANNQNAASAERINFLLVFFLNPMVGYADKNV
jgi:hypothetical protein